jgi:hypothetical protein
MQEVSLCQQPQQMSRAKRRNVEKVVASSRTHITAHRSASSVFVGTLPSATWRPIPSRCALGKVDVIERDTSGSDHHHRDWAQRAMQGVALAAGRECHAPAMPSCTTEPLVSRNRERVGPAHLSGCHPEWAISRRLELDLRCSSVATSAGSYAVLAEVCPSTFDNAPGRGHSEHSTHSPYTLAVPEISIARAVVGVVL